MKINRIIRILLVAQALFLSVTCLFACAEKPQPPISSESSAIIRSCDIQKHGRYIYRAGGRLTRYDPVSATASFACLTPDCLHSTTGTCPLDAAITEPTAVSDGRLYFYSFAAFTHEILLGWQDLITGEIRVLVTLSSAEEGLPAAGVHDGYLYYQCRTLREGGSAENPDDYRPTVSRVPVDGGRPTVVLEKAADEILWLVADGKLILGRESERVLYAYDIATQEKKCIYDLAADGFTMIKSKPLYTEGKLYFLAGTNQRATDPRVEYTHTLQYLVAVDVRESGGGAVIHTPVEEFDLYGGEIYYVPYKLRTFGLSADQDEGEMFTTRDDTLWACDLGGKNPRPIVTLDRTDIRAMVVSDGQMYGQITRYHSEDGTRELFRGAIDLASGELIPEKQEGAS